jgi:Fe-S oxidoreductase
LSRSLLSGLPQGLLPTSLPKERYLPQLSKKSIASRYKELVDIPASQADIAYFYGCSADLFEEPIADSFIKIARHNGWKISLPAQRCCGEPFAAVGNSKEYHQLAKYNIDQLIAYQYIIAHCPSCLLAFKEYARDFARIGEDEYAQKAEQLVKKIYEPAQFIMEVIGAENLKKPTRQLKQKVTIHLSCHEKLGQKITATTNHTRTLLKMIPGLEIVEMKQADEYCSLRGPLGHAKHYDLSRYCQENDILRL